MKREEMKRYPYQHFNGWNKPITEKQILDSLAEYGVYQDKDGMLLWKDLIKAAEDNGVGKR